MQVPTKSLASPIFSPFLGTDLNRTWSEGEADLERIYNGSITDLQRRHGKRRPSDFVYSFWLILNCVCWHRSEIVVVFLKRLSVCEKVNGLKFGFIRKSSSSSASLLRPPTSSTFSWLNIMKYEGRNFGCRHSQSGNAGYFVYHVKPRPWFRDEVFMDDALKQGLLDSVRV